MKTKRSRQCDISAKVKKLVWERDDHCCILCGNHEAMPNAHYIARSKGGLGIEENIVTLCLNCHNKFDQGSERSTIKKYIQNYLSSRYKNWDEKNLIYRR